MGLLKEQQTVDQLVVKLVSLKVACLAHHLAGNLGSLLAEMKAGTMAMQRAGLKAVQMVDRKARMLDNGRAGL